MSMHVTLIQKRNNNQNVFISEVADTGMFKGKAPLVQKKKNSTVTKALFGLKENEEKERK